jgi:hypothetical protein
MPNVHTLHIGLLGLYAEMSPEKGNPYKPHIHTLDIMNGLFMQLEMVFFLWNTFLYLRLRLYNDSGLPCTLEVVKQFV